MLGFAKKLEETHPLAFPLLGPLFLLVSLSLTIFCTYPNHDLWWIAILGLAFSWKFEWRGFFSALIALVFSVLFKHVELQSHHVWQSGLEASIALGLWITTYAQDKLKGHILGFQEEILRGVRKSKALEEELQRKDDQFDSEKNVMQERIDQIKKELEDSEIDKASLKELTRTLKENDAEKEFLKEEYLQEMASKTRNVQSLELKIAELQDEIQQLSDGEKLKENNRTLLNQLNVVRVDKYQSRLINEALAKTLTREMKKKEIEHIHTLQSLETERGELRQKIDTLQQKIASSDQHSSHETEEQSKQLLEKIGILEKERDELKHKLIALQKEIAASAKKSLSEKPAPVPASDHHRRIEASFRQLKKQFDEKKQVLHQTRTELFRLEGKLFAKEREEENQKFEPDPNEERLVHELQVLEEETENLENENVMLHEIIQMLNEKIQPSANILPPKKEKKDSPKEQQLPLYGEDPHLIPDFELGFRKKTQ